MKIIYQLYILYKNMDKSNNKEVIAENNKNEKKNIAKIKK